MEEKRTDGIATLHAASRQVWRAWLKDHHETETNVWLIIYKKTSGIPSVYYPEAVDEALCFGWIDSKPNKRDDKSYFQFFSKRNPKSKWSGVNKRKVAQLLKEGKMAPAGLRLVELAKQTGTWEALDEVENLSIPIDMAELLERNPAAATNFSNFPPSIRRGILEWIANAKKKETRQKRIEETVVLAEQNVRANQYIRKK